MMPVFLDTVGLLALWDSDAQWHDAAEKAYQAITNGRTTIATTFILLERGNASARRTYRKDVCDLRETLELRGELIAPTNEEWLTRGPRISAARQATLALSITFRFW